MSNRLGFINPSAQNLWQRSLSNRDRVLITGSSGWFGQTATHLMAQTSLSTLRLASSNKTVTSVGGNFQVSAWDWEEINQFQPTVVIDCAFLTRDLVTDDGLADYVLINERLTQQLLDLTELDSVRRVLTISSGAAMFPVDALSQSLENNPYGYLKRKAEVELCKVASETQTSAVIARAWAVSGAFIGKPQNYALANMIIQAQQGHIEVKADKRVERRYSAVEDLLSLALAQSGTSGIHTLDSEGPLVEMGELAEAIVRAINPRASITRPPLSDLPPNDYWSKTDLWPELCHNFNLSPAGLEDQIIRTYNGLKKVGLA